MKYEPNGAKEREIMIQNLISKRSAMTFTCFTLKLGANPLTTSTLSVKYEHDTTKGTNIWSRQ